MNEDGKQITVVPPTAMRSVDHLVRWLNETDRGFLVFVTEDLVRGLPDVDAGVSFLQQMIGLYRDYRATQSSGWREVNATIVTNKVAKVVPEVTLTKGEALEYEELLELREWVERKLDAARTARASKTLVRDR